MFGPIVGEGDTGLPGGLGLGWHQLFGQEMQNLMEQMGIVLDPRTGQPMPGPNGAMPTQQALVNAANIAKTRADIRYQQALATGYMTDEQGNQVPTLEREKFLNDQLNQAYLRAAAPNRAFENELARGSQGQNGPGGGNEQYTAPVVRGMAPQGEPVPNRAYEFQAQSGGGFGGQASAPNSFANTPVRVPAFINAFRQQGYTPAAGQIAAPSSTMSAGEAPLTEQNFQRQNLKSASNLNPYQQQVLGSFGVAGGVSQDVQDYWRTRGMPAAGSASGTYGF